MEHTSIAKFTIYQYQGVPVLVTIPDVEQPSQVLKAIANYLAEPGFSALPPDDGEIGEITVSNIIKGHKKNEDGSETPLIHLYTGWASRRVMGIYLNTQDERDAFEKGTGLKVSELPAFRGKNPPEKDDEFFGEYAVRCSFRILRKKVPNDKSPVGYSWRLVDYLDTAVVQDDDLPPADTRPDSPPQPSGKANGSPAKSSEIDWNRIWKKVGPLYEHRAHMNNAARKLKDEGRLNDAMTWEEIAGVLWQYATQRRQEKGKDGSNWWHDNSEMKAIGKILQDEYGITITDAARQMEAKFSDYATPKDFLDRWHEHNGDVPPPDAGYAIDGEIPF